MKSAPIAPILVTVFLSACAGSGTPVPGDAGPDRAQGEWKSESGITLTITDGHIAGSTGCNRFFGSGRVENGLLVTGRMGATRMMCSPDLMKAEAEFFSFLDTRPAVTRPDDRTLVLGSGERKITLTR